MRLGVPRQSCVPKRLEAPNSASPCVELAVRDSPT